MYKSTCRSEQRVGRMTLADLSYGDFNDLPLEQQRENLVARYKKLSADIKLLPTGQRKKEMGQEIAEVARRISAIRPKLKGPRDLGTFFMDVAREEMTKAQFDRLVNEATKRYQAAMEARQQ